MKAVPQSVRVTGAAREFLAAELVIVLGAPGSSSWHLTEGPGEVVVIFFAPITKGQVEAITTAHMSPEAIGRREVASRRLPKEIAVGGSARRDRAIARLAKKDPLAALLKKENMS